MALYGAETLDTSESGSEIPWKFWSVVLEKDGEDKLAYSKKVKVKQSRYRPGVAQRVTGS